MRTIALKYRINQPDNESVRCDASNQLDKRSGFCRFTGSSAISSTWVGTDCEQRNIGRFEGVPLRFGARWRLPRPDVLDTTDRPNPAAAKLT